MRSAMGNGCPNQIPQPASECLLPSLLVLETFLKPYYTASGEGALLFGRWKTLGERRRTKNRSEARMIAELEESV